MKKVYLANGLFSIADRNLNEVIAEKIRSLDCDIDLFCPQEQPVNDKNSFADSLDIFCADYNSLKESDIMIAVIDGVEVDSGVASEIGIASVLGIPIVALYSDVRLMGRSNPRKLNALIENGAENQFMYRNLFVIGAIRFSGGGIVHTIEDLCNEVEELINREDVLIDYD